LGRHLSDFKNYDLIVQRIEVETGARVPYVGVHKSLDKFFRDGELRDVLDAITHVYASLMSQAEAYRGSFPYDAQKYREDAWQWRSFVRRVLAEEHSTYEIDDECNVKYAIDEAYALSRKATISGLRASRWDAARPEFERAFEALDGDADTNAAVRAIAAAVESCLKIVIGNGLSRVGPAEIERYLWPKVKQAYERDEVAADAGHQLLKSLADWVSATHQYRHGQHAEAEVSAPLELAVQILSQGAAFIRWLIAMERVASQPAQPG
jgi:hypothetical protein